MWNTQYNNNSNNIGNGNVRISPYTTLTNHIYNPYQNKSQSVSPRSTQNNWISKNNNNQLDQTQYTQNSGQTAVDQQQITKSFNGINPKKIIHILKKKGNKRSQDNIEILKKAFKNNKFFENLVEQFSEDKYEKILRKLQVEQFQRNDRIFGYGDRGRKFYIIAEGEVYILVPTVSMVQKLQQEKMKKRPSLLMEKVNFLPRKSSLSSNFKKFQNAANRSTTVSNNNNQKKSMFSTFKESGFKNKGSRRPSQNQDPSGELAPLMSNENIEKERKKLQELDIYKQQQTILEQKQKFQKALQSHQKDVSKYQQLKHLREQALKASKKQNDTRSKMGSISSQNDSFSMNQSYQTFTNFNQQNGTQNNNNTVSNFPQFQNQTQNNFQSQSTQRSIINKSLTSIVGGGQGQEQELRAQHLMHLQQYQQQQYLTNSSQNQSEIEDDIKSVMSESSFGNSDIVLEQQESMEESEASPEKQKKNPNSKILNKGFDFRDTRMKQVDQKKKDQKKMQEILNKNPGFIIAASLKAGDFFGELALLYKQERSATAVCKSGCIVLSLSEEDYHCTMEDRHDKQEIDKITFLKGLSLFKNVLLESYAGIMYELEQKTFTQGEYFYKENSESQYIYFLRSGEVEIMKNTPGEIKNVIQANQKQFKRIKHISLMRIIENQIFGEVEAFQNMERITSAQCVSPKACVFYIDKKKFIYNIGCKKTIDHLNKSSGVLLRYFQSEYSKKLDQIYYNKNNLQISEIKNQKQAEKVFVQIQMEKVVCPQIQQQKKEGNNNNVSNVSNLNETRSLQKSDQQFFNGREKENKAILFHNIKRLHSKLQSVTDEIKYRNKQLSNVHISSQTCQTNQQGQVKKTQFQGFSGSQKSLQQSLDNVFQKKKNNEQNIINKNINNLKTTTTIFKNKSQHSLLSSNNQLQNQLNGPKHEDPQYIMNDPQELKKMLESVKNKKTDLKALKQRIDQKTLAIHLARQSFGNLGKAEDILNMDFQYFEQVTQKQNFEYESLKNYQKNLILQKQTYSDNEDDEEDNQNRKYYNEQILKKRDRIVKIVSDQYDIACVTPKEKQYQQETQKRYENLEQRKQQSFSQAMNQSKKPLNIQTNLDSHESSHFLVDQNRLTSPQSMNTLNPIISPKVKYRSPHSQMFQQNSNQQLKSKQQQQSQQQQKSENLSGFNKKMNSMHNLSSLLQENDLSKLQRKQQRSAYCKGIINQTIAQQKSQTSIPYISLSSSQNLQHKNNNKSLI